MALSGDRCISRRLPSASDSATRTPLCCSHQPDLIAAAAIFLAARALGLKLPAPSLWEALGVRIEEVREVAAVIMGLYGRPRARHVAVPRRRRERQDILGRSTVSPSRSVSAFGVRGPAS